MKRKAFLKKSLLGLLAVPGMATAAEKEENQRVSTYDKLMERVGFNHLPNKEEKTMKSILHRAETRGHANHGWLDTYHTFSFANYHHPERVHFGVLRVLNDDRVAPGRGFGTHPHDNMEIISIPLAGALEHKDSMGNTHVIRKNDVQVMSAGTGVFHSEYNQSGDQEVRFLQIWVFPKERNIRPRYDQLTLQEKDRHNKWQLIVSPRNAGNGMWINQDAYFSIATLDAGKELDYRLHQPGNGVYAFIIEGNISIGDQALHRRDGMGLWDTDSIRVKAESQAEVLLMEVPMTLN